MKVDESGFDRAFFERGASAVAVELLGHLLVSEKEGKRTSGRIVEVEAYSGQGDPASHAARRMTPRNRVMFGAPGRSYVYFTYGNHVLLNVVARPAGEPGAVLIRALEPVAGMEHMIQRRKVNRLILLTSGPGRLSQALGVRLEDNDMNLLGGGPLALLPDWAADRSRIVATSRIGIREGRNLPWRFYLARNPYVTHRIHPEGLEAAVGEDGRGVR